MGPLPAHIAGGRDVREYGLTGQGGIVAGQRQTDINIGRHRDVRRNRILDRFPARAVGRMRHGEVAGRITLQFDPVGRRDPGLVRGETRSVRRRAAFRGDAVFRRHTGKGMLRAGVQRLADHHARLRPRIRVPHAVDPRDNRAGAGERLEREVELIGRARDIGAGGGHRIGAGRSFREAAHRARVAPEPQRQVRDAFLGPVTRSC